MIRLAAFDLDQTLVSDGLTISLRVKEAIAQAQTQGVIITLATGRGPTAAAKFATELDLHAPLICFQGALIYDHLAQRILHEVRLNPDMIPLIVRLADERGWNLEFHNPGMIYFPREMKDTPEYRRLLGTTDWKQVDNFLTDLPETPYKFIISVREPADRAALDAELHAYFDPMPDKISIVASHPLLIEGLPYGINKAVGLAWVAEYLKIPSTEVMAVGDNDNDVEMLLWAGVGVAMSNGSPAALAAADATVPPVSEDGAAIALERFVLKRE
jgi:Cof subfamily protein (haloacid dehalogenase superfamily)